MQATIVHPGGSVVADEVHPRVGAVSAYAAYRGYQRWRKGRSSG